jgi:hypothetical protein
MPKKQVKQEQAPAAPKPKSKRTKGWQFEVDADGTSDPLPMFRAVASDPDVQYLAHTVDPESGSIRGVVRFTKPKSNKAFESGAWQTIKARGAPQRVTAATARTQLGNRVWAFGSLSGSRKRPADEGVELEEDNDSEQDE